ncbi:MAG: Jag N-terminal domain-containing protein [Acidimicrobiia bacterium]|nr:Jag N-terminal domain-containing protein [Acidimicrobiia bacterium]
MEWVNITAKTLPEAIDRALDNLGVDEAEAEIEVLEEPKQGLFGRLRGTARVRARVKPKATRPKVERGRNRKRRSDGGGRGERSQSGGRSKGRSEGNRRSGSDEGRSEGQRAKKRGDSGDRARRSSDAGDGGANAKRDEAAATPRNSRPAKQKPEPAPAEEASMEEVSAHLESFLSGLTDAFGFEGPVSVRSDEDDGLVAVVEGRHGLMVGPKGRTLDAIQELARVSAQRTTPSNIRIKVDVGGYREMRREALHRFAIEAAEKALADRKEHSLEPMSSADRKIVHDALSEIEGIETRSAGTEPRRRVVVVPVAIDDEPSSDPGDEKADADPGTDPSPATDPPPEIDDRSDAPLMDRGH